MRLTSPTGSHRLTEANVLIHPQNDPSFSESLYGAVLLGSPVGSDAFCINFLNETLSKLKDEAQKLMELNDSQSAFLLLKKCFSNKIQHLLRTTPPRLTISHLIDPFNALVHKIFANILKIDRLSDVVFQQCQLDVSDGGLGLGVAHFTAQTSFCASFIESFSSVEEKVADVRSAIANPSLSTQILAYTQAVSYINYEAFNPSTILDLHLTKSEKLQRLFSASFKKSQTADFMSLISQSKEDTARLVSSASTESSAFLQAIPKTPKLTASSIVFNTMLLRRLGCNIPQIRPTRCICSNHTLIDPFGVHLIACKHGPERHQTHDFMVQEMDSCIKSCGLYSKPERTNYFRSIDNTNGKRPDLEIRGLDRGHLGDVMITDPISSQLTLTNSTVSGRAALNAERIKNAKFLENSSAAQMLFSPFVFETYGRWGPSLGKFFTTLMNHGSVFTGIEVGSLTNYWRRRISFVLQKSIAVGILSRMGRLNSSPHHDESNWASVIVDQSIVRY